MGAGESKPQKPQVESKPQNTAPAGPVGPDGKPKKICCSCPDTKKLRDTCITERGALAGG
eukprot:1160244-Pelagomonas_calceolata.AAC.1